MSKMKTGKMKVLSFVLALTLLVGMLPMTVFAEEGTDSWDGTADTSWYDAGTTEFHLQTAEQLAGLSALTNQTEPITFTGKTIYLDADLDLNGHTWVAVSENGSNSATSSFSGTFDGQGHSINNLNGSSLTQRLGLFGTVHNATIKNINLYNATITAEPDSMRLQYGTLVSWASSSSVENCYVAGKVTVATDELIGGLIGQCTGDTRVIGCGVSVDVISTYPVGEIGDPAPTVGGVVGQFENAGENSLISNCYFDGSLSVTSNQAGCGGIFGACFDFDGAPGLTISNCILLTDDITCGNSDNITYIAAVDEDATVANCFWPDGDRLAVARLIVNWDLGIAEADPDFDQSICGESVADFTAPGLLEKLNANTSGGSTWVQGKDGYPVFNWQENRILADYTSVNEAIEKANAINSELYSNYDIVTEAVEAVDWNKSKVEQTEVDAMAQAIEDAITSLEYKNADYSKVDEAIAKANALKKDEYKDFSGVEVAIAAVVRDKNITEQAAVDAMAKAIEDAIKALEYKGADYSKVDEAIAKANALKKEDYKDFSKVEAAVKAVIRGKNITEQTEVDAMARAITDALDLLELNPPVKPVIIDGANQTIKQGESATFRSSADFIDFLKVLVDGKEISVDNYTVKEGSTIVTLKAEYLKSLSVGKHTLSIVSKSGSADTEFTVEAVTEPDKPGTDNPDKPNTDSPQTGDTSNMMLWVALLFVSGGALTAFTVAKKRKKQSAK